MIYDILILVMIMTALSISMAILSQFGNSNMGWKSNLVLLSYYLRQTSKEEKDILLKELDGK